MTIGRGLNNDHYVPQFLLRHFAINGKVHVFDKIERRTFSTNPRNIMSERGYNSVPLKDGAWIEFEEKFTRVEDTAKPAIARLTETESVAALTDQERGALLIFLVAQHLRARTIRDNYLSIGATIRSRFPSVSANDMPEHMEDDDFDKFAFLKGTLDDLAAFAAPLVAKHMFLMKWTGSQPVYISDNPLVMRNENDFGPYGNIGLAVPGIEIYLPISPTLVLALLCPTTTAAMKADLANAEAAYARVAADLFTGAPAQVAAKLALWSQYKEAMAKARTHHKHMFDDLLVPMSEDNLLYLNSLQIQWANRYIAAASDDFSFAQKALLERPAWVGHPTLQM